MIDDHNGVGEGERCEVRLGTARHNATRKRRQCHSTGARLGINIERQYVHNRQKSHMSLIFHALTPWPPLPWYEIWGDHHAFPQMTRIQPPSLTGNSRAQSTAHDNRSIASPLDAKSSSATDSGSELRTRILYRDWSLNFEISLVR